MANQIKGLWPVVLLVGAGAVILALTMNHNNHQPQQGVVLQEIFKQNAPAPVLQPTLAEAATIPSAPATDPVPALAIITSPENGHEAGYTIQVYSFQDKNRAEAALESLRNSGYKAFMVMSDLGEKGVWYRVRISGITDETQAQQLLSEIRKNYNSGFIVKPKA